MPTLVRDRYGDTKVQSLTQVRDRKPRMEMNR